MQTWDIRFYNSANAYMETSLQLQQEEKIIDSWKFTIPARLAYLAQTVVSCVALVFSVFSYSYGVLHALYTWDRKSVEYQTRKENLMATSNVFFFSLFGALVSPSVAHRYRDYNIVPYVVAFRITVISCGMLYYWLTKK